MSSDDALFDTCLSFSQLEVELQTALNTKATMGKGRSFVDLGGGQGIVSQMGLLTADWQNKEDGEELPATFAVKISAPTKGSNVHEENQLAELLTQEREVDSGRAEVHNTEIQFYEKMRGIDCSEIRLPKIYQLVGRSAPSSTGHIIMEHFSNLANLHMCDNIPDEGIDQVLRSLAVCHSSGRLFSDDEKKNLTRQIFGTTFGVMLTPGMLAGLSKMFPVSVGANATDVERLLIAMNEFSTKTYVEYHDNTAEDLGMSRVLCHGDVWMCNMLWSVENRYQEGERWNLKALVDWQTVHIGCAAQDLVRLLTGCVGGEERRHKTDGYIEKYYGYLQKEWKDEQGPLPYTIQQLKEAYVRMFPLCGFVVAGSIAAVGEMIIGKKETEKDREMARVVLAEKQEHLVHDILKYHQKNMEHLRT